jgi:hypothetical protein
MLYFEDHEAAVKERGGYKSGIDVGFLDAPLSSLPREGDGKTEDEDSPFDDRNAVKN